MEFSQVIRDTYNEYLLYLDNGGKRIVLPETEILHIDSFVHCSSLMDCPLKAAKERSNAVPIFPQLAKRNNPTLLHRMLQGTRCAEPFQEAFLWGQDKFPYTVYPEYSAKDDKQKIQGRLDLLVDYVYEDGNPYSHIVEFKHRLPTWKDKTPMPRMGDVFQLLAYMQMTNAHEGHLVIINTPQYADFFDETKGYTIWTLYKDTEYSEGWILQDENMDAWNHQLNHGGYINTTTLEDEVARQLAYINGLSVPPIDLNSEERWQCLKITRYQKESHPGIFHTQCAHWCHTLDPQENMPYIIDKNGEFIIL